MESTAGYFDPEVLREAAFGIAESVGVRR
jgi:hypothetical protein